MECIEKNLLKMMMRSQLATRAKKVTKKEQVNKTMSVSVNGITCNRAPPFAKDGEIADFAYRG